MRIRNLCTRTGRDLILNRFNSESVTQFYTHTLLKLQLEYIIIIKSR